MAPSTYSTVDTANGAKLSTIGQIQVLLSFNGRNFPCQFHVIEDMSHYAVLGRDFLVANDAVLNFTSGTLTLDNAYPIDLPLKAANSRPMTNLLSPTNLSSNQENDEQSTSLLTQLTPSYRYFVTQLKKASSFLLKFLILLLLKKTSPRPSSVFNKPRGNPHVIPRFVYQLSPVRLKNSSTNTTVTPIIVCNVLLQQIQINPPNSNHRKVKRSTPGKENSPYEITERR